MKVRVFVLSALISAAVYAASIPSASDVIVENYCAATKRQAEMLHGASMEVAIHGFIPKLKKYGQMHALRHITNLGRITYDALRFQGDDTVKRNVIAKYLQAEEQGQQDPSIAVTPENYKFKYKGRASLDGRDAHRFEVSPRSKRQGLYRGELWIDTDSHCPWIFESIEHPPLTGNPDWWFALALPQVEVKFPVLICDGCLNLSDRRRVP